MAISFSYCGSTIQVLKIASVPINETIQMHSHAKDGYEIHFIYDGKGKLSIPSDNFKLNKNSLFITGPNVLHKQIPDNANPMHEFCLYLVIKHSPKAEALMQYFTSHTFWIGKGNAQIKKLFTKIIEESAHETQWSSNRISALIISLIVEMVQLYTPQSYSFHSNKQLDLNESRAWILDELFYNKCIDGTLEDFAKELGVCPRQAERIVINSYGKTFKQQRQEARLSKAAIMLESGNISVEQCAQQCGYASVTSFSKAFKKKYQVTPKAYKLKNSLE